MSTSAITPTTPITATPVGSVVYAGANANAGKTALGQADFLKLLTAQLSAQDPMEPMQNTEFISQMANFTSLQNSQSLLDSFKSFQAQQSIASAPSYLGKYVTLNDPSLGPVSGIVDSVSMANGTPSLIIGGKNYATSLVTAISTSAPAAVTVP